MRWDTLWAAIKDIVLTGTGIAVIFSQVISSRPSDPLLVVGLALTVPSVAGHATALVKGPTGAHSSSSSDGSSSSPSSSPSPPSGGTGEQ